MVSPSPSEDQKEEPKTRRFDLSVTQVIASALAAVVSAVVASFLGVAGTFIGAAVGSIVLTTGTAIFKDSLRRTNEKVKKVVPKPVASGRPESDGTVTTTNGVAVPGASTAAFPAAGVGRAVASPRRGTARVNPVGTGRPAGGEAAGTVYRSTRAGDETAVQPLGAAGVQPSDATVIRAGDDTVIRPGGLGADDSTRLVGGLAGGVDGERTRLIGGPPSADDTPTVVGRAAAVGSGDAAGAGAAEPDGGDGWKETLKRQNWKRISLVAGGVFLLAVVVILATELIAGGSLSSLLYGKPDGGTSVGNRTTVVQPTPTPEDQRSGQETPSQDPGSSGGPGGDKSPQPGSSQEPSGDPSPKETGGVLPNPTGGLPGGDGGQSDQNKGGTGAKPNDNTVPKPE